ncbi:MFS transporter [Nocardia sp. NPDC048505]|uniref:MFS transporter n=1 Tax=unclassified Nocardia TaxID=2637762 RepID=UPI0033CBFDAE
MKTFHQIGEAVDSRAQRRTLQVLVAAQALSGAGLAAGVTVGALLAQDMLDSTGLAGLPSALGTAGSALAAVVVARISHTRGRRPGLVTGYLVGALGSLGVVAAATLDLPLLLFSALAVYGAGTSTNLQARYAGADLASPAHRARAVSTVLLATTAGAVIGPNLTQVTTGLARRLHIPDLAGPFLVPAAAYAGAAAILAFWLRPDPLLLARTRGDHVTTEPDSAATVAQAARRAGLWTGVTVVVLAQMVMVAIMTMTPVHMSAHTHDAAAAGLAVSVHLGAMYLPSPVTGRLVDRYGRPATAAASGVTLGGAAILAATAPSDSVTALTMALALLGLGWNLGLVAGTAMVTDAASLSTRATVQGRVDVGIAIAAAVGGLGSGAVVAAAGYPTLALGGGGLALIIVAAATLEGHRARRAASGAHGQAGIGAHRVR